MSQKLFSNNFMNSILGTILACGSSYTGGHNKCEIYKIDENKWESIASYPFVTPNEYKEYGFIGWAPVIYHESAFYTRIENLIVFYFILIILFL